MKKCFTSDQNYLQDSLVNHRFCWNFTEQFLSYGIWNFWDLWSVWTKSLRYSLWYESSVLFHNIFIWTKKDFARKHPNFFLNFTCKMRTKKFIKHLHICQCATSYVFCQRNETFRSFFVHWYLDFLLGFFSFFHFEWIRKIM